MQEHSTFSTKSVVQIDEGKIQAHLDQLVRNTVEETLNALLDAEADQLWGARLRPRGRALHQFRSDESHHTERRHS
jgi:putative transposase